MAAAAPAVPASASTMDAAATAARECWDMRLLRAILGRPSVASRGRPDSYCMPITFPCVGAVRASPASPAPSACGQVQPRRALVGAHGAQHEMVGARRADDLQADRQAGRREAGGHRGRRLAGEVAGQRVGRALGPAREGVGVVERLDRRRGGRRHRRQQQVELAVPERQVARELRLGLVGLGVVGQRDRQALLRGGAEAGIELAVELRRDLAEAGGEAADPQRLEGVLQRLDQRADVLDMRAEFLEALRGRGDQRADFRDRPSHDRSRG